MNDHGDPNSSLRRPHLKVVETKQDKDILADQIRHLLDSAIKNEPESAHELLARMNEESLEFERITGIKAWGPPLEDLAKLTTRVPIHHSKIAKLYNKRELYYDIRLKRLNVEDSRFALWSGILCLLAGFLLFSLGLFYPDKTKDLTVLIKSLSSILFGATLMIFSMTKMLEPFGLCRKLRPYIDSLYEEREKP